MTYQMPKPISKYLRYKLEMVKEELKLGGLDGRSFRGKEGDLEYAEWELCAQMEDREIWDGWTEYDKITSTTLWKTTLKWQGWYNMVA